MGKYFEAKIRLPALRHQLQKASTCEFIDDNCLIVGTLTWWLWSSSRARVLGAFKGRMCKEPTRDKWFSSASMSNTQYYHSMIYYHPIRKNFARLKWLISCWLSTGNHSNRHNFEEVWISNSHMSYFNTNLQHFIKKLNPTKKTAYLIAYDVNTIWQMNSTKVHLREM